MQTDTPDLKSKQLKAVVKANELRNSISCYRHVKSGWFSLSSCRSAYLREGGGGGVRESSLKQNRLQGKNLPTVHREVLSNYIQISSL